MAIPIKVKNKLNVRSPAVYDDMWCPVQERKHKARTLIPDPEQHRLIRDATRRQRPVSKKT